jgi:DNA-binding NarL/FixJ family response regulator
MSAKSVSLKKTGKKRLFLVEDHPVTREGFAQLLNYQSDLEVCGQAGTAAKAMLGIDSLQPDLAIVDITLAESNGLELIKNIKVRYPRLPVLVLSTHDESIYAERAVRAGARGYVMKQAPTSELMGAIRQVLSGNLWLSEAMRTRFVQKHLHGEPVARQTDLDALSDRELEVFDLIGHGYSTRRIATKLRLSVSTVETYRAHLKEKLHLADGMELVRRAVEWVHSQAR